jgi:hypothetical protein
VEHFWELGPQFEHVDMPVARPEVSHPLLRRLGPSPFGAGPGQVPAGRAARNVLRVISEAVVKAEEGEPDEPADAPSANGQTPLASSDPLDADSEDEAESV